MAAVRAVPFVLLLVLARAAEPICSLGVPGCPALSEARAEELAQEEGALGQTALLQKRVQANLQPEALEDEVQKAFTAFARDRNVEEFLRKLKVPNSDIQSLEQVDVSGIESPQSFAESDMERELDAEAALQKASLNLHETLATSRSGLDAPEVTLPGGATVKGQMMPGPLLNASFQLGGFDTSAFVHSYTGIKYATAKRWEPPVLYTYSEGETVDGTKLGPECAQSFNTGGVLTGSEDCLIANVYVPKGTAADANLPVMVWIHGGNLVFGSANQYHGFLNWLATEGGVVVVALNYRLNVFGFFYSPNGGMKANFGNRDQIMGLHWVKENIAAFGGDPNKVTLFGQSGGARSVSVMYMSPLSKGLFHAAIAQSPGALDTNFFQPIEMVGQSMGAICQKATGCSGPDALDCMRNLTAEALNAACSVYTAPPNYLAKAGYYMSGFDGEVLPHSIRDPLCKQQATANNDKPIMSGSLLQEWTFFDFGSSADSIGTHMAERLMMEHHRLFKLAPEVIKRVYRLAWFKSPLLFGPAKCTAKGCSKMSPPAPLQMASNQYGMGVLFPLHGGGSGKRYRYSLNIDLGNNNLGSGHCGDLCLLFSSRPWTMPFQKGACGDGQHQEEWKKLGVTMRQYWTNFAKTGVPSAEGAATWTPMVQGKRAPVMNLNLGKDPEMSTVVPFSPTSEAFLVRTICQ